MVYSVFYYASEAITRAIVGLTLKIIERMQRRKMVEEKPKEERMIPRYGLFSTVNEAGLREYMWVGRATKLKVSIPDLIGLRLRAHELGKPPTRLYFTFAEAASKDWFKEIEWLAKMAEKAGRGE